MGRCMIKDILVSLPVGATSSEAAVDYAISVATGFDAHLAGLALTYEPYVPGSVFNGVAALDSHERGNFAFLRDAANVVGC